MKNKLRGSRGALFLFLFLFSGCGDKIAPGTVQVERPVVKDVSLADVVPVLTDEFYETAGTIRAARVSYVASRLMGAVTSLAVREGDRVKEGQLLLTIDDRDVKMKVRAAEAAVRETEQALKAAEEQRLLAEATYERYRKMYEEKAISRQEMDQFETQKKVAALTCERLKETTARAEAGLSEAKVYLDFTRILSPAAGMIAEKKADVGSMAAPGMPLLTLEGMEVFNGEFSVDEGLAASIRPGAPAEVFVDSLNRQIKGKITEVLPNVDALSRTFTVKVALTGAGLRSGLYARLRLSTGKKATIVAPRAAIVEKGQLTGVYAVDDQGVITYRLVRTGKSIGEGMEILSGLDLKDRIIVRGVERAVDGGMVGK